MDELRAALSHKYLGTTLQNWLVAAGLAVAVTFGLLLFRRVLVNRMQRLAARTDTHLDDAVVSMLASLRFLFFVGLGLWVAAEYVALSQKVQQFLRRGIILLALVQLGLSFQAVIRTLTAGWTKPNDNGESKTAAAANGFLLTLAACSTLACESSAVSAGLGVGAVAAALAVQSILGDLFASLSIYFDRPFHIGDFIIVGSEMGTVERIGLRSTRVRSLGGEEIVFANGDLGKSRIRNYKRMNERRVLFTFGVEYATDLEQLRAIPALVKSIVESREGTRFDRAHFKEYGDYSLVFEVVYYVLSPDYNVYMDHQHAINLELFREFAERRVQFAFPTQTTLLYPSAPLSITRAPRDAPAAK